LVRGAHIIVARGDVNAPVAVSWKIRRFNISGLSDERVFK
jgi:hypothetical protein